MGIDNQKIKRSLRISKGKIKIKKQVRIAKINNIPVKEPHRLLKKKATTCGNSNCFMCGNPRKFFKEKTIQEKRFEEMWKENE